MENQHRHIKGYRELTAEEIALMNAAKAKAEEVKELIQQLREKLPALQIEAEAVDVGEQVFFTASEEACETDRWLQMGQDHLQQGFMAIIRAIARPTTF